MIDLPVLSAGPRLSGNPACRHQPPCPDARATDRFGARAVKSHPQQGWSLLCNGVVLFDDGGALLPGGTAVPPAGTRLRVIGRAA
jgi:hypothetical protein